jgi:hypothetical protein
MIWSGDIQATYSHLETRRTLRDTLDARAKELQIDEKWKKYVESHPGQELSEDMWEDCYLPAKDEDDLRQRSMPSAPLVLDMPHISRRVAAQRSQFIIFGTDPFWLSETLKKPHGPIVEIVIAASARDKVRSELRDTGVSESVIFPDLDGLGREIKQHWDDRRRARMVETLYHCLPHKFIQPMSFPGQSRPGRADGRSGHVGYPPIATDFSGAANFAMCQRTITEGRRRGTLAGALS